MDKKTHLTYRLGNTLIQCDKDKFKGAYLSFFLKKSMKLKKTFAH